MLTWKEVVPFLDHDKPLVVCHAAEYLADVRDLPADVTGRAVSALKKTQETSRYPLLNTLKACPPTMELVHELLELGQPDKHERRIEDQILRELNFSFLIQNQSELFELPAICQRLRKCWQERLELSQRDPDWLWSELFADAERAHVEWQTHQTPDEKEHGSFDWTRADRIIEALSRHSSSAEHATAILSDPAIEDFRELYATRLLGVMRHEPAIDLILSKLLIENADLLHEHAIHALAAIGTPLVVRKIEAFIPGKPWGVRLFADDPLEHIRLPDAEAAQIRLLQAERSADLRSHLAFGLCQQCTTDGYELVHKLFMEEDWDPQDVDLYDGLVGLSIITGRELPQDLEAFMESRERDEQQQTASRLEDEWRRLKPSQPVFAANDPAVVETIRRVTTKVGRNDPCPCGSQKKYKNCCLKKQ